MTIKTFNTGRGYSSEGQRIAYQVVSTYNEKAVVAMVDVDRGLNYMLSVHLPFGEDETTEQARVLLAYDENQVIRSIWMEDSLRRTLEEAARNQGRNRNLLDLRIAVVPVDATPAMIAAAQQVEEDGYDAMHKAMIKASPNMPMQSARVRQLAANLERMANMAPAVHHKDIREAVDLLKQLSDRMP